MMMMMLNLVSSLAFQITFGAEPLASISRPFHLCLPFLNVTSQVILRTQVQVSHTTQLYNCYWPSVATSKHAYLLTTPASTRASPTRVGSFPVQTMPFFHQLIPICLFHHIFTKLWYAEREAQIVDKISL